MMTETRSVSLLDKHLLPLSHQHSRPSSAASASTTSTSNNSSPFSSPQSPATGTSLPPLSSSESSSSSFAASKASFDDFLQHLNFAPTITSSSQSHKSSISRQGKPDPLQSSLTPPFTAEPLSQSSSFSIAPTVTSSLASSPRHSSSASTVGRPQAIVPPLAASHQHRDFVQSAHLPSSVSANASFLTTEQAGIDDDDDLSAAWNGHSTLSFDVDDYDETDFQLAAQQLRATTAAKQLAADIAHGRSAQPPVRSVSVSSSSSTIVAPPGFHYHNHQLSDASSSDFSSQIWDNSSMRSQQQQQPSVQNHYQLYNNIASPALHSSHNHRLQQQHKELSPSLAASFPAPFHSPPVSGPANGCNLYVDQLPIPFSEHDLRTIFAPFGHIEKLRVAIDPVSGEQMGYGFVLFSVAEDAHRAIVALHGCGLGGKTMHVSVAKQRSNPKRSSQPNTPSYTASASHPAAALAAHFSLSLSGSSPSLLPHLPNTNVYLAGIPHCWVKADLDDLTHPFGHIMESRVLVDKQTQENRGIGFVRFERVEEAANAILALNGSVPPGGNEVMTVKLAVERGEGRRDSLRNDSRAMTALQALKTQRSMSGTDALFGSKGLDAALQRYNQSDDIVSPRRLSLTRQFSAQLSASSAAYVSSALSPPPIVRSSSDDSYSAAGKAAAGVDLFVFHLPVSCTESELVQLFSIYGNVLSCAVMRDRRTGEHKGFGFVTMDKYSEAEAAVKYLTGYALGSKYLKVSFKTNKQPSPSLQGLHY